MTLLRRLSGVALLAALGHVVFGGFVRISGSGMGCGDHWPKCYGYWFPPLDRPDLVIEVFHRYFAATLSTVVAVFLLTAFLRRAERGVAGRGGVLRAAALAFGIVIFAATLGAVTVNYRNDWWATLAHKAGGHVAAGHIGGSVDAGRWIAVAHRRHGQPGERQDRARHHGRCGARAIDSDDGWYGGEVDRRCGGLRRLSALRRRFAGRCRAA
ncbi:MAG: hypothetical protein HC937_03560, partial [Aquincola sp.]|nr:hypothetical protein [Aquincola sp.]